MAAKIYIDALKILTNQEMRLKIGKKLKTASLNSRFTDSKEECILICLLLKIFVTKSYC